MRIALLVAALSASLVATTSGLGSVGKFGFLSPQPAASAAPQAPSIKVWVNLSSRVYHCPGTRYYGVTKRGKFMTQAEAQNIGSRPAYGQRCSSSAEESVAPSIDNAAATFYSSTPTAQRLEPSSAAAKVWVNRKSHVYHCAGTQYYGTTKSGEFMLESEATASGNRPAYGRSCS